jgi:quinol monooxygenase YgiN
MINVIASIRVKQGRRAEFLDIFRANMANILQEQGCLEYVPTVDLATGLPSQEMNEHVVTIIEKWQSLEDLQAHLAAPHMLAYRSAVKDIVAEVSLKVLVEAE